MLGAGTTLTLESNPVAGATPTDLPASALATTASGDRAYITTSQSLTPGDADEAPDIYEWTPGGITLLSALGVGGVKASSQAVFEDATPDGSYVFFSTPDRMTGDDTDDTYDIYQRHNGAITLVSAPGVGAEPSANFVEWGLASDDGSSAIFRTEQRLVAADNDNVMDVYLRRGGQTLLVSKQVDGTADITAPARPMGVSADGTRVLFQTAEALVAADADNLIDVYSYDTTTGNPTLVSQPGAGNSGPAASSTYVGSSSDGTKVFFETTESLVAADTDGKTDVYRRSGSTTTLMTVTGTNPGANDDAFWAANSADGSTLVFTTAQQMSDSDSDDTLDIWSGTDGAAAALVSAPGAGAPADSDQDAYFKFASADASRIFWESDQQMTAGDSNSATDVFATAGGVTRLVSSPDGVSQPSDGSTLYAITPDGARAVIVSVGQLTAADTDGVSDVYERDPFAATPQTTLVSVPGNGAVPPNAAASFGAMSSDGQIVFFNTDERMTGADTDSFGDAYRRDLAAGQTTLASPRAPGAPANQLPAFNGYLSADGSKLVFLTAQNLIAADTDGLDDLYLRSGGQTSLLIPGNGSGPPAGMEFKAASPDFSRVIVSTGLALDGADTDDEIDLYLVSGGQATLLTPGTNSPIDFQAASDDATAAVFQTPEDLDPGDGDTAYDLYKATTSGLELLTPGTANDVTYRGMSKDASKVFFSSAEDLTAGSDNDNGQEDVFQASGGTVTTVSVVEPPATEPQDAAYFEGVSDDGSHVIFSSSAPFSTADSDGDRDLYDRSGGQTSLVSAPESGAPAPPDFGGISPDGSQVWFSTAEPLVGSDSDASVDVYERSAGQTTLVSVPAPGGNSNSDDIYFVNAVAGHVLMKTGAQLTASDTDADADLFERTAGQTLLVSAPGTGAAGGSFEADFARVSNDGKRIFFTTYERLTDADNDADSDVYVRADGATTLLSPRSGGAGDTPEVSLDDISGDGLVAALGTTEQLTSDDTDLARDLYLSRTTLPDPPVDTTPTQTQPVGTDTTQTQTTPTQTSTTPTTTTPTGTAPTPTKPQCKVPKLKGLTLKQAKAKLKKAHCALGTVTKKKASKRSQRGKVLAQKLKPGTKKPANFKVRLTLGR